MNGSLKINIWNKTSFVFVLLAVFSFGFMAIADEQETITAYFDDQDQDKLSTEEEKAYGTDPNNADTDGDSYSDGVEIESGYDPLKPAPGDRVVPEESTASGESAVAATSENNLTDMASQELANLIEEKQEANAEVTHEDLNAAVAKVLETANEEVILPEVPLDDIKIKELPKKLDEEDKEKQKKEDTLEYLTTVSYVILSNMPGSVRSTTDLQALATSTIQQFGVSVVSGNYDVIDSIISRSQKIVEEINSVPVPEHMLDTHVKAVKVIKFLGSLGERVKAVDPSADPVGQMMELARMQGGMFELQNFLTQSQQIMTDFGIKEIPLDI